jgi:hypothetical protein
MAEDVARKVRKKKEPRKKPKQYISPDGAARDPETERRLNEAFAIVFKGAAAEKVRDYLRSITINRVLGPGTPVDTINYFEGARWLMGIIDSRIKDGEEKKP